MQRRLGRHANFLPRILNLFLALAGSCVAQTGSVWQDAKIPGLAWVTALDSLPGGLFAGTKSGRIFRSRDLGKTWTLAFSGAGAPIQSFASSGTSLFAAAGTHDTLFDGWVDCFPTGGCFTDPGTLGGLFRSEDTGQTWTQVPQIPGMISIADSGNGLYACGATGLYRSKDQGNHWSRVECIFPGVHRPDFASGVTGFTWQLFGDMFLVTAHGAVWTAQSGTDTLKWKKLGGGGATSIVKAGQYSLISFSASDSLPSGVKPGLANVLYHGGIWTQTSSRQGRLMRGRGYEVLMPTDSGIIRSYDQGGTWNRLTGPLDSLHGAQTALDLPEAVFTGGMSRSGVWAYHGTQGPWAQSNDGIHDGPITALALHQGEILAADGGHTLFLRGAGSTSAWAPPKHMLDDYTGAIQIASTQTAAFYGGSALYRATGSAVTSDWTLVSGAPLLVMGNDKKSLAYWSSQDSLLICSPASATGCEYRSKTGVAPVFYRNPTDYKLYSRLSSVAISGDTVAVMRDSLYLSTDRGEHFENLRGMLQINQAMAFIANRLAISYYAGLMYFDLATRVYAQETGYGLTNVAITSMRTRGSELYALASGKVYVRYPGDFRWTCLTPDLESVAQFDVEGNLAVIGMTNGEIYTLVLDPEAVRALPRPLRAAAASRGGLITTGMAKDRFFVDLGLRGTSGADGRVQAPRLRRISALP